MFRKPRTDLANMAMHLMQQEARLRLQADMLAALIGQVAKTVGAERAEVLDHVQEAGLRASDDEERLGDAIDRANAIAMREEVARIMAKAAAGAADP